MAAVLLEVKTFRRKFFEELSFCPTNTKETQVVAIKNTELRIMMTSCASYRKRSFAGVVSSKDNFAPEQYQKMPDRNGNQP